MAESDQLFEPATKLFSRPTKTEFGLYCKWLREVVQMNDDAVSAIETNDSLDISPQMCVFLFFLRLGVPASQITPQNINTPEEWAERHKRKPWSSTVYVPWPDGVGVGFGFGVSVGVGVGVSVGSGDLMPFSIRLLV